MPNDPQSSIVWSEVEEGGEPALLGVLALSLGRGTFRHAVIVRGGDTQAARDVAASAMLSWLVLWFQKQERCQAMADTVRVNPRLEPSHVYVDRLLAMERNGWKL